MNGKNIITTTKVPIQKGGRRRRRRGPKPRYVVVEKPIPTNTNKGGKGSRRNKRRNKKSNRKGGKIGKISSYLNQDKELGQLAAAMMNPFHQSCKGVRLKDASNSVTDTFFVKSNGRGSTNSNGNGWITISPALMVANDQLSIYVSEAQAGSGDTMNDKPVAYKSSSPYNTANFINTITNKGENAFRPIGVGIRVRNLSTVFQSSGVCYTIQTQPRITDLTGYDPTEIQKQQYKEYPYQNDKFHTVTRHITDPLDYNWQWLVEGESESVLAIYEGGNNSSGQTLDNPFNLGIYIVTNSAQPFEWEIYAHYERKGPNLLVPGIAKPNSQGMSDLTYSMGKLRLMDPTVPDHTAPSSTSSKGGGFVDHVLKGVLDKAWEFML